MPRSRLWPVQSCLCRLDVRLRWLHNHSLAWLLVLTACSSLLSVLLPGFAGYFDAVLYKDVHLGIEPATHTPDMFSW